MCEVIASSNTFRVKQKRLHLGIIDKVMTLVRENRRMWYDNGKGRWVEERGP